jgi:hypothetical protein
MKNQMLGSLFSREKLPELSALIMSAIWLLICVIYVDSQVGWSALSAFLPHEIGAIFTGIFAPLAFMWIVIAHMRRSSELRETSLELQQELRRLAFPGDDNDERSQTIADDLRRYAEALSSASDNAAIQSENLKQVLTEHTSRLERASEVAASRANATQEAVTSQTRELERATEGAVNRVQELGAGCRNSFPRPSMPPPAPKPPPRQFVKMPMI